MSATKGAHDDGGRNPRRDDHTVPAELKTSVWEDVCDAVYESRYVSMFALLVALYCGYSVTIAPYQTSGPSLTPEQRSLEALKYIRPVLTKEKMAEIYTDTLYGETSFELPRPSYDTARLMFQAQASKHGHFRAPSLFYEGVVFGLTWQNSHQLEYYDPGATVVALEQALLKMEPKPSSTFLRSSRNNATGWMEEGLAVHFSNADLQQQGMLSSDVARPWKRTQEGVMQIARRFKLAYIYQWYPHHFGVVDVGDPYKHSVVIQEVVPTRTGLDGLKSSATVWLSALNYSEPSRPPKIIRKEWSSEDHWSDYPVDN